MQQEWWKESNTGGGAGVAGHREMAEVLDGPMGDEVGHASNSQGRGYALMGWDGDGDGGVACVWMGWLGQWTSAANARMGCGGRLGQVGTGWVWSGVRVGR